MFKGAGGHHIEFTQSKYLLSINFVSHTIQGARPRKMKKAQALTLKTLTYAYNYEIAGTLYTKDSEQKPRIWV